MWSGGSMTAAKVIFERQNSSDIEDIDIVGEDPGDKMGISVTVSSDGKVFAVGASRHDGPNGTDSGHVKTYNI